MVPVGHGDRLLGPERGIPVPAGYDGTGGADIGVLRPSIGGWYVSGQTTRFLDLSGDVPVPGDYDGDGDAERGVFRPAIGGWHIDGQATTFFGLSGNRPLSERHHPGLLRLATSCGGGGGCSYGLRTRSVSGFSK